MGPPILDELAWILSTFSWSFVCIASGLGGLLLSAAEKRWPEKVKWKHYLAWSRLFFGAAVVLVAHDSYVAVGAAELRAAVDRQAAQDARVQRDAILLAARAGSTVPGKNVGLVTMHCQNARDTRIEPNKRVFTYAFLDADPGTVEMNMGFFSSKDGSLPYSESDDLYLCEYVNHGKEALSDVIVAFKGTHYELARTPNSLTTGKAVRPERLYHLNIPALDPGPEHAFRVYLTNGASPSQYHVGMIFPVSKMVFKVQGNPNDQATEMVMAQPYNMVPFSFYPKAATLKKRNPKSPAPAK